MRDGDLPKIFSIPARAEDIECCGSEEGCLPWSNVSILWIRLRRESWVEESLLSVTNRQDTRGYKKHHRLKESWEEMRLWGYLIFVCDASV